MTPALRGEERRPGRDLGMLAEECATLTFGQSAPDAELDAVIECIGTAFELHRAVAADDCGFPLSRSTNEEFIGILATATRPCHPRQSSFVGRYRRCRHEPTPVLCRCALCATRARHNDPASLPANARLPHHVTDSAAVDHS